MDHLQGQPWVGSVVAVGKDWCLSTDLITQVGERGCRQYWERKGSCIAAVNEAREVSWSANVDLADKLSELHSHRCCVGTEDLTLACQPFVAPDLYFEERQWLIAKDFHSVEQRAVVLE